MAFTKHELEMILATIESLSENQSCNDMELENTMENRKLIFMAMGSNTNYIPNNDDWDFNHYMTPNSAGYLATADFVITGYLKTRIQEELNAV